MKGNDEDIKVLNIKVTAIFYNLIEEDCKKKGFSSISEYARYYIRNAMDKKDEPPVKKEQKKKQ